MKTLIEINYWAVLACGAASMVIGMLWYGWLFMKPWSKEMGFDQLSPEKRKEMQKKAGVAYPQAFIGALIMAFVLAHTLFAMIQVLDGEYTVSMALQGAFWTWLGFIVPVKYGDKLWGGKSFKLFAIDSLYYLVQLGVFAIILVLWR